MNMKLFSYLRSLDGRLDIGESAYLSQYKLNLLPGSQTGRKELAMKTMLDILKERLPEGLEITKVQDRSNSRQVLVRFSYQGIETVGYLNKTCAPGHAERTCDLVICSTMLSIGLKKRDLNMVQEWADKQNTLTCGKSKNGEVL